MGSVLGFPGVDPLDAAIGQRLKSWREKRGVSIEDLASALDLTPVCRPPVAQKFGMLRRSDDAQIQRIAALVPAGIFHDRPHRPRRRPGIGIAARRNGAKRHVRRRMQRSGQQDRQNGQQAHDILHWSQPAL